MLPPKLTADSRFRFPAKANNSLRSNLMKPPDLRRLFRFNGQRLYRRRKLQYSHVGQISVTSLVVQTVTDNELIIDFETDVVRLNLFRPLLVLREQHTAVNRYRAFLLQSKRHCMEGPTSIENIIQKKHVPAFHFREMAIEEIDLAR